MRLLLPSCLVLSAGFLAPPQGAVEPELVQPGVISTDRNETFPAIDPRDGSLWFSVYDRDFDAQTLVVARARGAGFERPVRAPFAGEHGDRAPRFSPDGRRLYFTSNRPAPGYPAGDMNIWVVTRAAAGGWSTPGLVGAPVSVADGRDIHNAVLEDGTLFVASNRPGGAGRSDVYRIPPAGGAEPLPAPINDEQSAPDLWVSPDGSRMILVVTNGRGGLGGDDLYGSTRQGEGWTAPRNLGSPINSAEYEYGPAVSPDGRWLYFTSHRRGNADLYRIRMDRVRFAP